MAQERRTGPTRTEKLVSLTYALLSRRSGYTKDELRVRVDDYQGLDQEAFDRKFERDKTSLRQLGVPLDVVSGEPLFEEDQQEARYRILPENYRLPEVSFTAEEALALGLAAKVWKDPTIEAAAARAVVRLGGDRIGEAEAAAAFETFEARLHAGDEALEDLLHATWERVRVGFTYRAVDGAESRRRVEPWGLGNRFGHWYLVGLDLDRSEKRIFRLSRITSAVARVAGSHFERPTDFDVSAELGLMDPSLAATPAVVELAPGRGLALRAGASLVEPAADGFDAVSFTFHDAEATSAEIAELGAAARVREPRALRDAVVRRLADARAAQARPVPPYKLAVHRNTGRPPATVAAARALDIIAFVSLHGSPTLAETAEHFGLTEKRLVQELTMIRMCGVPNGLPDELIDVDYDDGVITMGNVEGLADPLRLNLVEALSLVVGLRTLLDLPGAEASGPAAGALEKLLAASGEYAPIGRIVAARLGATEADGPGRRLADAAAARRVLRIGYHNPSRDEVGYREVEPVRLLEDGGRSYLQAWCRKAGGARNFRVDRILAIEETGEVFAPGGQHTMQERLYVPGADDVVVVLGFDARLARLREDYAPTRTAQSGDRVLAEVRIADAGMLPGLVARHGGGLTIADPPGLAATALEWLDGALAGYSVDEEARA
ncbi:helix-turn-helix transcriptional regulator [Zafaria sp. Z1313]|uniref:helix-turn-helix transcriptional regulator n=1 Tax=unclassified Zafaria TaxID=2828765 RepID=UPI002E771672|nr:WYL domain-containing protein [Zafaria sp. J156]MEE1621206.1 WYL domain-containing protein [Zafaria sp. J156]